jgi:hypothetical protein
MAAVRRGRPAHTHDGWRHCAGEPRPGDEAAPYSERQLLIMDARFSDRLERAFAAGKESRASARMTAGPRSR